MNKKVFIMVLVFALLAFSSQSAFAQDKQSLSCEVDKYCFDLPAGAVETASKKADDGSTNVTIDLSAAGSIHDISVTFNNVSWTMEDAKNVIEKAIALHKDENIESDMSDQDQFYKGYVITKDEDTYLGSVIACSPTAYMMAVFAFDETTKELDESIIHQVYESVATDDSYVYKPLPSAQVSADSKIRGFDSINRKNPVLRDETAEFTYSSSEMNVQMNIVNIIKGASALQMVMDANSYNNVPAESQEYYVITLHVSMTCKDDNRLDISSYSFEHVSTTTWQANHMDSVSGLNDSLSLYPDGSGDIQVAFLAEKDDPQLLLFQEDVWFSLDS